jgi:hypothetical protein
MKLIHDCRRYYIKYEWSCYQIEDEPEFLHLSAEEYKILVKICPFCGYSIEKVADE